MTESGKSTCNLLDADSFLKQVQAIGTINTEIIEQIKNRCRKTPDLKLYSFHVTWNPEKSAFSVSEELVTRKSEEFLAKWKTNQVEFVIPIDLFGDKIDFTCTNFDDLCRVNAAMVVTLAKYYFLEPTRTRPEIEKFKNNLELIQQLLGEIEGHFTSSLRSSFSEIQEKLESANDILKTVFNRPDVNLPPPSKWSLPTNGTHILTNNNHTATQTGNTGTLLSTDGYSVGTHVWHLKIIQRPSTCMIGVAPRSVSNVHSAIYSTQGHFVNLNGGNAYVTNGATLGSHLTGGVTAGATLDVILDCNAKTLSFSVNKATAVVTHRNILCGTEVYLAWNNDSTSGSVIEILE